MKRTGNLALYALTMAASGASLLIIRVTETFGRGSIFCSSTSCFVESVLWSLPGYAALLAVVMTTALMAAALVRERVGPPVVRIAALLAAVAGAIGYVVAAVVTLDFAWAGAFSGQLSPRPTALLPPILVTFAPSLLTLSLMLTGVSIALTSLLLLPLRAPRPLVVLGWVAGVAMAALVSSAQIHAVRTYALPVAFLVLTAWASYLAIVLMRRSAPKG